MAFGKFEKTEEKNFENVENIESKVENNIEHKDIENDVIDKKMDMIESINEESGDKKNSESFFDKLKNVFKKSEFDQAKNEIKDNTTENMEHSYFEDKRQKFLDSLKVENYENTPQEGRKVEDTDNNNDFEQQIGEDGERTRWSDRNWERDYDER